MTRRAPYSKTGGARLAPEPHGNPPLASRAAPPTDPLTAVFEEVRRKEAEAQAKWSGAAQRVRDAMRGHNQGPKHPAPEADDLDRLAADLRRCAWVLGGYDGRQQGGMTAGAKHRRAKLRQASKALRKAYAALWSTSPDSTFPVATALWSAGTLAGTDDDVMQAAGALLLVSRTADRAADACRAKRPDKSRMSADEYLIHDLLPDVYRRRFGPGFSVNIAEIGNRGDGHRAPSYGLLFLWAAAHELTGKKRKPAAIYSIWNDALRRSRPGTAD